MKTENKGLTGILGAVAVLLLIPFLGMQLSGEVKWSRSDFIAGVLLLGTGLACEVALLLVKSTGYRLAICGAILFTLAMVWVELAVGIIGTRFAGS